MKLYFIIRGLHTESRRDQEEGAELRSCVKVEVAVLGSRSQ